MHMRNAYVIFRHCVRVRFCARVRERFVAGACDSPLAAGIWEKNRRRSVAYVVGTLRWLSCSA